jgi:hypothetical protein
MILALTVEWFHPLRAWQAQALLVLELSVYAYLLAGWWAPLWVAGLWYGGCFATHALCWVLYFGHAPGS